MDYYLSSTAYHHYGDTGRHAQDRFSEQLIQMQSLNFHFEMPAYQALPISAAAVSHVGVLDLQAQRQLKASMRVILCPQHLPKFHPDFDEVILPLLMDSHHYKVSLLVSHLPICVCVSL